MKIILSLYDISNSSFIINKLRAKTWTLDKSWKKRVKLEPAKSWEPRLLKKWEMSKKNNVKTLYRHLKNNKEHLKGIRINGPKMSINAFFNISSIKWLRIRPLSTLLIVLSREMHILII